MIPQYVLSDKTFLDENGNPQIIADIYDNFIRVHPDYTERLVEGIELFHGIKCKVFENREDIPNNKGE